MLLLENPTLPQWVWQWQHADFLSEFERPSDVTVTHMPEQGSGYVCNFNEIKVFFAQIGGGQSIILDKRTFQEVQFQQFENHQLVDVTFTPSETNPRIGSLSLRYAYRIIVGTREIIRMTYQAQASTGSD
jgi:hypothetical protein